MYGKDSYFSGSMLVFKCFYGVFMQGLRSRGEWGLAPILDKLESFVVNAFWLVEVGSLNDVWRFGMNCLLLG